MTTMIPRPTCNVLLPVLYLLGIATNLKALCSAFVYLRNPLPKQHDGILSTTTTTTTPHFLASSGQGFGTPNNRGSSSSSNSSGSSSYNTNTNTNNNDDDSRRTYGTEALSPFQGLMDVESAMREFFVSNQEWQPLFRSLAVDASVPAMTFLREHGEYDKVNGNDDDDDDVDDTSFEFHENTRPWRRLEAIPTREDDRAVLATFLDSMQQSLVDIPVDESTKDDENDLHFIEEGRRMLVCSRFHVIQGMERGSIDSFDSLFSHCWNEIAHLALTDEADTGSIIVVPGFEYDDLRRFADMNLQRPLEWLGIQDAFEVASLQQGGLGVVRMIHKLSDIPDLPNKNKELDDDNATN